MNCHDIDEQLIDYLYGEMRPEVCRRIEEHLEGCPRCAEQLAQSRVVLDLVSKDGQEPSPLVGQRIMAMAREESEKGRSGFWRALLFRPAAVIPTFVAVFALGAVSYNLYSRWDRMGGPSHDVALHAPASSGPMALTSSASQPPDMDAPELELPSRPSSPAEDPLRRLSRPSPRPTAPDLDELRSIAKEHLKEVGADRIMVAETRMVTLDDKGIVGVLGSPKKIPEPGSLSGTTDLAYATFAQGNRFLTENDYPSAIRTYETTLTQQPESPWAPYSMHGLALGYHAMGRCREALDTIEALHQRYPRYSMISEVNLLAIQLHEELGEHDEAEEMLRYCMDRFPDCGMLVTERLTTPGRGLPNLVEVSAGGGPR